LLEHGLEPETLQELSDAVRASLLTHPVASGWWAVYPFPLLVAATEVGYIYRGTGTDFWPIFAARAGATSTEDRASLSSLFRATAERFGLVRPSDTPWNRAFCHIAWPVLHSILPIELHLPLARALREVRVHLDPEESDAAIVAPVRRRALLLGGVRLIAWLEEEHTAAAVIRQFLRPDQGSPESSALARIARDLARDEAASTALREARKRQQALGETGSRQRRRPTAVEPILATLVLRSGDQRYSLAVKIPQMEQSLRESARDALVAMRWRASLWSQGRPVPARNIFSDYPVPVTTEQLPTPDTPLIADTGMLPVSPPAKDFLGALRAETKAPLLFTDIAADGDALQLFSRAVSDSGRYILLVGMDERPPAAESLGRVAGLRAFRIDASSPDVASWLEHAGFDVRRSAARLTWIGNPEVEQHRPRRRFRCGDFIAFALEGSGSELHAELVAPDGSRSSVSGHEQLIGGFTAKQSGSYTLHFGAGEAARFDIVEGTDEVPLITVDVDAGTGAISDLADRQVTLRFDSSRAIQEARLELRLICDGREAARANAILPDTPCRLGGDHEIWDQILTEAGLERLLGAKAANLCVAIPGLVEASFRFEQQMAPFSWKRDAEGKLTAFDEAGELAIYASVPQRPFEVQRAGPEFNGTDVTLFRAGRNAPLQFGGLCDGPAVWRASDAPPIPKPDRLLRQFEAKGSHAADGCSIADALIAWSAAAVDHPVTQFRRGQVLRHLESWLVEQLCGSEWIRRERQLATRNSSSFAQAFLRSCDMLRVGYAEVALSRPQRALLDRILLRLIDDRALPITLAATGSTLDDELAIALDELFNDAYEALAERIESVGDAVPYDPDEDIDVGEPSDVWEKALASAGSEALLSSLVELLRPLGAGDELGLADFDAMLPDDVVDHIYDWIGRNQPQHHARSWNRDLVEASYWLFARPAVAARLSWRASTERLLADRFSARAIRYAALRSGGGIGVPQ
jgi:hypothetical protein